MRFTMPQMLIAVGVVAVMLGILPFRQRSANYHRMASENARPVGVCKENAKVRLDRQFLVGTPTG